MKKAILMIAIVALFTSCKKDKVKPGTLSVFGKWELASIHGNLPQPALTPAGNGNIYIFRNDSTYVRYVDNQKQGEGKFSIQITEVRDSIRFGTIRFTNPNAQDAFQTRSTTILFGSNAADGPVYEYRKVK